MGILKIFCWHIKKILLAWGVESFLHNVPMDRLSCWRQGQWICSQHHKTCVCVLCSSVVSTLCKLVSCSPPGSSVHGISQPIILEWVAIASSSVSSPPILWTTSAAAPRWILYDWVIWEAQPASQYIMTLEIMYLLWAVDLKSGRPVFESCIQSLIPGWSWGNILKVTSSEKWR